MSTINLKGWQRVLIFLPIYLVCISPFAMLGAFVSGITSISEFDNLSDHHFFIIKLFELLATIVILWIFIKIVDDESFSEIGFKKKNKKRDIISGILLGLIIMYTAYYILIHLNEITFIKYSINLKDFLISIGLLILVAFLEEIIFRGYVLKNLMLSFNNYFALIISSILFAVMHSLNPNLSWFSFFDLFLAGILLGISYIYTKSLWFPIALHFSWNFFQTHFGFNVSGQDSYSLIEIRIAENNILNGGDFGFEGSIFSTIIQFILIVCIVFYYERKKSINII